MILMMKVIATAKTATMIKMKKLFLIAIIYSLEFVAIGASSQAACWQRKYGYLDQVKQDYQAYYNRPYAPYPYYRGAFIP